MRVRLTLLALLAVLPAMQAAAAPRTPAADDEVIERLPARLPGTGPRRVPQATAVNSQGHADLASALLAARQSIEQARQSGDPRDWGQAEAALKRWWQDDRAPAAARLLRAIVRQGQHDFAGALADLDSILAPAADGQVNPLSEAAANGGFRHASWPLSSTAATLAVRAQAELTRAAIHQVQGRYALARQGCERLAGADYASLGAQVQRPAWACLAELDHLQGRRSAKDADRALAELDPHDGSWITLIRAELAARQAWPSAGRLFEMAAHPPGGSPGLYSLAAYADWLLDQRRPAEAKQLLTGYDAADALLLRRAMALKQLAPSSASAAAELPGLVAQLQARFDAALARGDHSHAREQALFALDVQGEPKKALALAQANWSWQREPTDALLLLRAAQAAGQAEASEPVRQWAREQGFVDRRWPMANGSGATKSANTPRPAGKA